MKITATLISAFALVALVGCTSTLTGGGEFSLGMRMDNFLVIKHDVDPNREGKTAQVQMELDANVWDLMAPKPTPAPDPTPEPETP